MKSFSGGEKSAMKFSDDVIEPTFAIFG